MVFRIYQIIRIDDYDVCVLKTVHLFKIPVSKLENISKKIKGKIL